MSAVGSERISAVVGYIVKKGDFRLSSPNLPQRVAVLCEANTANQGTLDTDPWQATSAQAVGARYGYGSPAYLIARILLPISGGGLGGIPLYFYPQAAAVGATSKILKVVPSGTATGAGTHTLIIAGRDGLDGQFYNFTVAEDDTASEITAKMTDAVNAVLGSPVTASDYDYETRFESKWKGATADDISIRVETNGDDLGITYTTTNVQSGAGVPSIGDALDAFGNEWNTIVINSYGLNTAIMGALETFNGRPDPENPTGRYVGTTFKPFIALSGSISDDPSAITDARSEDVTISVSPAPNSEGLPMEAAANDCATWAPIAQNYPHLDILNKFAPDMPTPDDIGTMADYNNRDRIVQDGCSTVDLVAGKYQYKDPVTTYHPEGEIPPYFRYRRDLMIDWNIRYGYYLLEQSYLVGHVIANDEDIVTAQNVIKPKQWKSILIKYFEDLVARGLIVDADFSTESLSVDINATNPNRLDTSFKVKRTGVARISATEAITGFNFGSITA